MKSGPSDAVLKEKQPELSRRQFVQGLSAFLAGGVLVGCGVAQQAQQQEIARWGTPTPVRLMASPQPSTPEVVAAPQAGELSLDQFMLLSAVLTGFANLNPTLGRVYLQSLQQAETEVTLAELYEQIGFQGMALPEGVNKGFSFGSRPAS